MRPGAGVRACTPGACLHLLISPHQFPSCAPCAPVSPLGRAVHKVMFEHKGGQPGLAPAGGMGGGQEGPTWSVILSQVESPLPWPAGGHCPLSAGVGGEDGKHKAARSSQESQHVPAGVGWLA